MPMTELDHHRRPGLGDHSDARVSIRIGKHAGIDARVTSAGLLSVAVLVSSILLSTAVVVVAATGKRLR